MSTLTSNTTDTSVRNGADDLGGAERLERQLFVALLGGVLLFAAWVSGLFGIESSVRDIPALIGALVWSGYRIAQAAPDSRQRLLAGGLARSVRAQCGNWDATRPTEGAYAALVPFDNGAFASLLYNGYGYFDGDEQAGWVSELGLDKDPAAWRSGRSRLAASTANQDSEAAAKAARNYGGTAYVPAGGATGSTDTAARHHQHFGHIVVSCERADLRPGPDGVTVYADGGRSLLECQALPT